MRINWKREACLLLMFFNAAFMGSVATIYALNDFWFWVYATPFGVMYFIASDYILPKTFKDAAYDQD